MGDGRWEMIDGMVHAAHWTGGMESFHTYSYIVTLLYSTLHTLHT